MRKIIILIFTLLTILMFLGIRTFYNFAPDFSLLTFIKNDVSDFNNFNWKKESYTKSWAFVSYEMIFFLTLLLISSFLKNKYWLLISSVFLFVIWLKNYILYNGIIDGDLYLKTSVFFIVSLLLLNLFNLFSGKKQSSISF